MTFRDGPIDGIIWKPLTFYRDPRGWLCELFRHDELPEPYHPVMAYMSMTEPGVARGPHEHVDQSDYFCFIGPSDFKVYLWDARPQSPTLRAPRGQGGRRHGPVRAGGPAGRGARVQERRRRGRGVVFNGANRLYKGWGKKEPVDEIRHEDQEAARTGWTESCGRIRAGLVGRGESDGSRGPRDALPSRIGRRQRRVSPRRQRHIDDRMDSGRCQ